MPDETISTHVVTTGIGFEFDGPNQHFTVLNTGSLTSTTIAVFSDFDHSWLALSGNVRSQAATAISLHGDFADVNIGYGVAVSSGSADVNDPCVVMRGNFGNLYSNGSITSTVGGALLMAGFGDRVLTNGDISGVTFGVDMQSPGSALTNNGSITATGSGYWSGCVILRYDDCYLENNGTISVTGDQSAGVLAWGDKGTDTVGGGFGGAIVNSGTIQADGGYGIWLRALANYPSQLVIINSGVISGTLGAILADVYDDHVTNSGSIIGDVVLNGGNDTFDGMGGTVQGRILGGTGNDHYLVSDSAANIVELAGGGRDWIEATVSFDLTSVASIARLTLLGWDALDATGNAENNVLEGNMGANHVIGADGYDRITGLFGNDTLDGGAGEDELFGGKSKDVLQGGDGDDRMTGGAGGDAMTGGAGADVFLFTAVGQSRPGGRADTIADFTSGVDRINLAGIDADPAAAGDQALSFIGTLAFGGVAGQVRYDGGVLAVDLDGDGTADFSVVLTGAPLLVANDLSL